MPVAGDCGPGVKDEAGAAHETEIRHQYRPVRSRNFPAVLIFHCYHVSPLGNACHTYILKHNHLTQFLACEFLRPLCHPTSDGHQRPDVKPRSANVVHSGNGRGT